MTATELIRQMDAQEQADIAATLTSHERVLLATFIGGESIESVVSLSIRSHLLDDDLEVALCTLDCLGVIEEADLNPPRYAWNLTAKGRAVLKIMTARF